MVSRTVIPYSYDTAIRLINSTMSFQHSYKPIYFTLVYVNTYGTVPIGWRGINEGVFNCKSSLFSVS